ncbi:MerR family transcriptional regulator [Actinoplanes sp. NPDC051861]|uniref:MerR family transcriptional regulator n=1 Tax=Actinoplanes sp. NPDC051861 TaxID=3155170 RepID=UPI00341EC61E
MRISELSRRTGVPVATIKFYLREGLLPAGTPTGRNQAQYDEFHERRLLFIRALTGIGELELSTVSGLLSAIEQRNSLPALYRAANRAAQPHLDTTKTVNDVVPERTDVDRFIADLGWQVNADVPGRERLAQVLASLRELGCGFGVDFFRPYAELAEGFAAQQLSMIPEEGQVDGAAAVARAVLLDVAIAALCGMAQEHLVAKRFGKSN